MLATVSGPVAQAADMPVKAIAPEAPLPSWTGCYFGAQVGATRSDSTWTYVGQNPLNTDITPPATTGQVKNPEEHFGQQKALVGGQIGCNFMQNGPWVVGVEAAWIAKAMNRTRDNDFRQAPAFPQLLTTEISSIASFTGRLGYAFGPDWLIYAKGGVAIAKIRTEASLPSGLSFLNFRDDNWHYGGTVGGGIEYRLFGNVTIGAEYNYYHFGRENYLGVLGPPVPPVNFVRFNADADVHTIMAKLNFYDPDSAGARAAAARPQSPGTYSAFVNNSASYSSWTGDRGPNVFALERGKGQQVYSPTTIGIDYVLPNAYKVENRLKTGYVYSHVSTPSQIATYSGPVDTQVSINTTLLNFDSIRPQFGVAANLPTGTSYLPNNQRFTRMDPDLVDVGSFGAGYNVNPTAGFVIGLNQNTAMSFSGGYAWQGAFIREAIDLTAAGFTGGAFDIKRKINPGDVFTGNVNYTSEIGALTLLATFAYMSESTAEVDNVESGRAGARYTSNLTATYKLSDRWSLTANGSHSFSEKNRINLGGSIVPELKNSNSHVVIGSIEPSYLLTDRLKLAANYSFLWRDENFYDQIENQFIPAKTKHTVGGSASYAMTQTASIVLRGSHSWIEQDTSAFLPVTIVPATFASLPPALSYQSWNASIAANLRF